MFKKKLLSIMFTAVFAVSAVLGAASSGMEASAQSSVSFYTGCAAIDQYLGWEPQKISTVKVPEKCTVSVYNSDEKREDGTLASSDKKIVTVKKQHQGAGWYVNGEKEGKSVLSYSQGRKKGQIEAEVIPALKLEAVKKSAKLSGGKVKLTLTYKNSTDTDIVIEGADTGSARVRYEKEKEPSKEAVAPVRWMARKVTIPAGKTKTFTVSETAKKSAGGIKSFEYPKLYMKYRGVYFAAAVQSPSAKGYMYIEYFDKLPYKEFIKK